MASATVATFLPQGLNDLIKDDGFGGVGAQARSRSTSAGKSSSSESQVSPPLSPPLYPADALGLPQYDYPTPWSIEQAPPLHTMDYPQPFILKNTFMGFDVGRPLSLEGFYEERQTKSCPASGIGLPPGLEDLVEPEEAAARLVAAEAALRLEMAAAECSKLAQATYHLPDGLFDAPADFEYVGFHRNFPEQPPLFGLYGQQCDASAQGHMASFSDFSPMMQAAEPLPLLLDSLVSSLYPPQQTMQAPFFDTEPSTSGFPAASQSWAVPAQAAPFFDAELCTSGFTPASQSWAAQPMQSQAEPQVGSPECPTLGSQDHQFGTCRPCAFLFTKGCGNGVLCSFCHLCDAGEKKRRMKMKRTAIKASRQWGC